MPRLIKTLLVITPAQAARPRLAWALGCRHPCRDRGDFMLEALIGVLLMGLVSVGITQVFGKMQATQREFVLQQSASHQLRNQLMQGQNLCALSPIARYDAQALTVTVRAGCAAATRETVAATVTIGNAAVPADTVIVSKPVTLAVTLDAGDALQMGMTP